ncbi:hypothetical protein GQ457_01G027760 [Hibiscus cannabinus]
MHVTDASVESLAKISPSDADTVIVDVGTNSATINETVKDSYASKVKGYRALVNRVTALWKPIGSLHIIDLDNNYFLVRFSDPSDYSKVLTEGSWTIYGSYLTVQPWSRQFTTTKKHPTHVIVWVRLSGLPYRYYTKAVFRHIASLIGRVVRIDYNTDIGGRGKFARLAIVVDLKKPLLSCIRIEGRLQTIEYEGLHQICFECGIYEHNKDVCKVNTPGVEQLHNNAQVQEVADNLHRDAISESSLFGPWMVVADRRRRGGTVRSGGPTSAKPTSGSRFESLLVDDIGGR